MKKLLWITIFSAAATAQAGSLPTYLEEQLDAYSGSSAFQLAVNDTINDIAKNKSYRENITKQVDRDLKGWEGVTTKAAIASAAIAVTGIPVMFVASTGSNEESASSAKRGIDAGRLSAAGAASTFGVGGVGGLIARLVLQKDEIHNLLNETKADEYAKHSASLLAKFFLLPKSKEQALKFAIKEEIYRKNKANDLTPIDMPALVKNTKYAGQPILSTKEIQTFETVHAELVKSAGQKDVKGAKPAAPELKQEDKIAYLVAANAMLEVQIEMHRNRDGSLGADMYKLSQRVERNKKLLGEIGEFKKMKKSESGETGSEDGAAGAQDAE